ncbi:hypothetical protein SAMN05660860_03195 [Geoalkalibacter ferrihydriticus]|uniref:Uncharacterized protein n=1 Tax=Geoalkalibacter ferrihydriticus TaxID=392333 RepID=A0A1G9W764_9BACT|nr:hypothetical protein SAMN05660860_03195 [Geoalkalibacter ferrihydriticus]
MPCACRYFLPGHVWHITHRCHKKEFLLKFARGVFFGKTSLDGPFYNQKVVSKASEAAFFARK